MIRRSIRYFSPDEPAAKQWFDLFYILRYTDMWRERDEGLVEILEFCVEKAWLVSGCDRGGGCCPGCLLLRTPDREFICLGGTVPSSPAYDFRWASIYKSGRCDGDHVVIERWPKTKRIYSLRFSGAPVKHVDLPWDARRVGPRLDREMPRLIGLSGCHIVDVDGANDLPEDDPDSPEDEH
jgi:hypothetical protein